MAWWDRLFGRREHVASGPADMGSAVRVIGPRSEPPGIPLNGANGRDSFLQEHLGGRIIKAFGRSRESIDTEQFGAGFVSKVPFFLPPDDHERLWTMLNLDAHALAKVSPIRLMEFLADMSPAINRALFDFQRMFNPGWDCIVYSQGSHSRDVYRKGQGVADAFMQTLGDLYGTPDVVFNRLSLGTFLRGAVCGEVVFGSDGRTVADVGTPDPASILFEGRPDPIRGWIWVPYQWVKGKRTYLDIPTFKYIPVDPFPGKPYGRPLASAALFPTLFLLTILHDLRRVVSHQGWPRIDLEIDLALLWETIPLEKREDPVEREKYIQGIINKITLEYAHLQPEDAYVHSNVVKINGHVGTVDASALGAIGGLIDHLNSQVVQALKTMPLLMGLKENGSETHANRQWEIYAQGIKSIQHAAEALIESMITRALNAQGLQGRVEFRFHELRTSELIRDMQVEQLKTMVAFSRYLMGFYNLDEACKEATGKEKAAEKFPLAIPKAMDGVPPPGAGGPTDPTGVATGDAGSGGEGSDTNAGKTKPPAGGSGKTNTPSANPGNQKKEFEFPELVGIGTLAHLKTVDVAELVGAGSIQESLNGHA